MEARDGIEPPSKALQTLPFSFWVPRLLSQYCKRVEEMRAAILRVPFHKVPPPKESMKECLGESRLEESIPAWTGSAMDLE